MEEKDRETFPSAASIKRPSALREEFDKQEKLAELIRLAALQEELQSIHAEMEKAGGHSGNARALVKRISGRWWWLAAAGDLASGVGPLFLHRIFQDAGREIIHGMV